MPKSALPEHLNEPYEWNGKDDDQHWYTSWRKQVKGWFAYGPRAKEKWAKWRESPKVLYFKNWNGPIRYEWEEAGAPYISRVQLWCRAHIQFQWPLFVAAHWYQKKKDIVPYPYRGDRDGKLWFFYLGAKRDADRVYWFPALYIGRNWK